MRAIALALPVMMLLAASAQARDLKPTIDAANKKFVAAFNKGDAATLSQYYTKNATVLPPGAQMVHGREAVERFWKGGINAGVKNLTLHAVSVQMLGNSAAREIGRFTLEVPDQQKQMVHAEGKYVVIWKHVGKSWKLDTDIWNTNN